MDESGDFDRWTYRVVTYETMLGGAVVGVNENHGEVLVEPVAPPDHYYLQEVYTTRSLHGWLLGRWQVRRMAMVPGRVFLYGSFERSWRMEEQGGVLGAYDIVLVFSGDRWGAQRDLRHCLT